MQQGMQQGIQEGRQAGIMNILDKLVKQGLISSEEAKRQMEMAINV